MGKNGEEDQHLPTSSGESDLLEANVGSRCCRCRCFGKIFGLKCLFVLFLSVAVFLSAIFWLPPFLHDADQGDSDLNPQYRGHDIVASFYLEKPASLLEDNIFQLEDDILDEIGAFSTKVLILSLEPLAGTNITKVVFAVGPEVKNSKIPEAAQSLIRWTFQYLVINDPPLRLTTTLFGEPFLFEVLKFPGGITIVPSQSGFLLQTRQTLFNFTLNFSIHQIQAKFGDLRSQLKSGLHLAPYENLYVSLFNPKGSTVAPPTTVLSSVLLAVGNTPSKPRLKQLAQTIKGSHSRNLGLNHTVFGRVKQVRLSSILQHSLGGDSRGLSPSPAPSPNAHYHHLHHQSHHHQHGHVPAVSPAPAKAKDLSGPNNGAPAPTQHSPAPVNNSPPPQQGYAARPPGCPYSNRGRSLRKPRWSYITPTVAPKIAPHHAAPMFPPTIPPRQAVAPPPLHKQPRAPLSGSVSASSPLPSVQYPSRGGSSGEHSDTTPPSISPSTESSSAGPCSSVQWALLLFLFPVFLL